MTTCPQIFPFFSSHRRRNLVAVAMVGIVLCGIAVLIVHHFESELMHRLLRDLAASQVPQVIATPETGADREDVADQPGRVGVLKQLAERTRDHFVTERVVNDRGIRFGMTVLPGFEAMAQRFSVCLAETAESWRPARCDETAADGSLYFFIREPLYAPDWFFEGIFRASPEAVRNLGSIYLSVAAAVVLTMLAALALMYPAMHFLQSSLLGTTRNLLDANLDLLKSLGCAIAKRDSDTEDHNFRVTMWAVAIAEAMGLDAPHIRSLIKGALLHDVGKIAVPDAILLKPGKLDARETAEMQRHVVCGLDIIASSEWLADARDVVASHHEWVDGTGYPLGLCGNEIPLTARIFAVADVFDALMNRRPYKPAMSLAEVVPILKAERGRHFDSRVLDAFLALLDKRGEAFFRVGRADAERAVEQSIRRYFPLLPGRRR